ncbi:MAG: hypothetical protein M1834_000566 [Cirrosporium novae-zelandiae]|nr:MAG: hypothetical protein M1834_000566 [Cirrosporium novae-zelandiae]
MNRLRGALKRQQSYEPLENDPEIQDDEYDESIEEGSMKNQFAWIEYSVFLLVGVAMLWAWNMFMAAAPYFQRRFKHSPWILSNFQSAILSVSTITNLSSMLILTNLQAKASYPKRISSSLVINIVTFTFLALSTTFFRDIPEGVYFVFLLLTVAAASFASALSQNGLFSYASGFGRPEYTQAIMTGQGLAGVLPCVAQILSVISVSENDALGDSPPVHTSSAFAYFLTATLISAFALGSFVWLHHHQTPEDHPSKLSTDESSSLPHTPVSLLTLFFKLRYLALGIFLCFGVTMSFPVFTTEILSIHPDSRPGVFIPLAFLLWNLGDFIGRIITISPVFVIHHRPSILFIFSIARTAFVPLYLLCNIGGHGAIIQSDFFYLVIIQFFFGLSNGWLSSNCMMGAGEWVNVEEREAAGGFMGLMLVSGLTVGSLASFLIGGD